MPDRWACSKPAEMKVAGLFFATEERKMKSRSRYEVLAVSRSKL
jgi:hypothetical protein